MKVEYCRVVGKDTLRNNKNKWCYYPTQHNDTRCKGCNKNIEEKKPIMHHSMPSGKLVKV